MLHAAHWVFHIPIVMQSPLDWVMQPGNHVADHQRVQMHSGMAAEFCLPVCAPSDLLKRSRTQYDLSSVRALINCSEPVRAKSMSEFQMRSGGRTQENGPAILIRQWLRMSSRSPSRTFHSRSGPPRLWADGAQFRGRPPDRSRCGGRFGCGCIHLLRATATRQ